MLLGLHISPFDMEKIPPGPGPPDTGTVIDGGGLPSSSGHSNTRNTQKTKKSILKICCRRNPYLPSALVSNAPLQIDMQAENYALYPLYVGHLETI